jgi:hypothetical protein
MIGTYNGSGASFLVQTVSDHLGLDLAHEKFKEFIINGVLNVHPGAGGAILSSVITNAKCRPTRRWGRGPRSQMNFSGVLHRQR